MPLHFVAVSGQPESGRSSLAAAGQDCPLVDADNSGNVKSTGTAGPERRIGLLPAEAV